MFAKVTGKSLLVRFYGRQCTDFTVLTAEFLLVVQVHEMNKIHLCATSVIPGEFHQQFLGLKAEGSVRDCLPETDEEDNVESK